MKKRIITAVISSLSLSCLVVLPLIDRTSRSVFAEQGQTYYVDFFNNFQRESFTLSNGFTGIGNNLIFKTVQVEAGGLVSMPSETPTRPRSTFLGWFKEEEAINPWNFASDTVTKNTRLFAGWGSGGGSEIVEPTYTPPSTVLEESASYDYIVNSIMNFKIVEGECKVSSSAFNKLTQHKDNVLPLMEYKAKNSLSFTAIFNGTEVKLKSGENELESITITNNSSAYRITAVDSSNYATYESKATKYESNYETEESYHVMLAGSSSIEFWESSKEDLDPIVSYNHGIGGTTIEMWTNKLNQRLVYPYKPKMVVYYVGINNVINSKQSSETINGLLDDFFNKTHEAMPDTKVLYIMLNQLSGYPTYKNTINAVNDHITNYQKQGSNASWLTLVNPGTKLLKENGEPSAAYFRTDGLHLSYYGYTIWGEIIKEAIIDVLEKMN